MAIPNTPKRLHEMDRVERAIDSFSKLPNPKPQDLAHVAIVSQVELGIEKYRNSASDMTRKELRDEAHQSSRLAKHLEQIGDFKPHKNCHAHAIVSGSHKNSAPMRAILALHKLRIDDAYNGCWLPENTNAVKLMPKRLKNAVPHSRIHRYNYYFWLGKLINLVKIDSSDELKYTLKTIGLQLQAGVQPSYVMCKKGEGINE